jgi:hypothetical protein
MLSKPKRPMILGLAAVGVVVASVSSTTSAGASTRTAGAIASSPMFAPPGVTASCRTLFSHPLTLLEAKACAPGAVVLAPGTGITADGTYLEASRQGSYAVVTLSSQPTRSASRAASTGYVCGVWHSMTVWWQDGVSNTLYSEFCYNGSTSSTYNTYGTCNAYLMFSGCDGHYVWDDWNYTPNAQANGRFHSHEFQVIPLCQHLWIRGDPWGHWLADFDNNC